MHLCALSFLTWVLYCLHGNKKAPPAHKSIKHRQTFAVGSLHNFSICRMRSSRRSLARARPSARAKINTIKSLEISALKQTGCCLCDIESSGGSAEQPFLVRRVCVVRSKCGFICWWRRLSEACTPRWFCFHSERRILGSLSRFSVQTIEFCK
jgi:hypothetical protein